MVRVGGKQIKRSLKTNDTALARRRLAEFRQKAERLTGDEKGIHFDELAKRWLESIKPHLKATSYRNRLGSVNGLNSVLKGLPARSMGLKDMERWQAIRGPKLQAYAYNREADALRLILNYAKDDLRIILDNPADRIKKRRAVKPGVTIPSHAEFKALITEMKSVPISQPAADLVEFMAYSGCRVGEAREVRWRNIDDQRDTLTITGGELGTKNYEARTVPLFPALKKVISRMREKLDQPKPDDKIHPIADAKNSLKGASKRAKLPRFTHHAMRHFFCSNAIEAGIDFKVIAGWLGHKDGGILVAKTYGHLRAEHSASMAQRMTFHA